MKHILIHKLELEQEKVAKFRREGFLKEARQAKRNVEAIERQLQILAVG